MNIHTLLVEIQRGTVALENNLVVKHTLTTKEKVLVAQRCPTICNPMDYSPGTSLLYPRNFPVKNTKVGSHSFLRGIFLTQGSNPVS